MSRSPDLKPNFFIKILISYMVNILEGSIAHNFLAWGCTLRGKQYRLEIGRDNGHTLTQGRDDAINELATSIYLTDNSDYLGVMRAALRALSPSTAEQLEKGNWQPFLKRTLNDSR